MLLIIALIKAVRLFGVISGVFWYTFVSSINTQKEAIFMDGIVNILLQMNSVDRRFLLSKSRTGYTAYVGKLSSDIPIGLIHNHLLVIRTELKLMSYTNLQKPKPISQCTEDNFITHFVKSPNDIQIFMHMLESV